MKFKFLQKASTMSAQPPGAAENDDNGNDTTLVPDATLDEQDHREREPKPKRVIADSTTGTLPIEPDRRVYSLLGPAPPPSKPDPPIRTDKKDIGKPHSTYLLMSLCQQARLWRMSRAGAPKNRRPLSPLYAWRQAWDKEPHWRPTLHGKDEVRPNLTLAYLVADLKHCSLQNRAQHRTEPFLVYTGNSRYLNHRYDQLGRLPCRKNAHDCVLKVFDHHYFDTSDKRLWNYHKVYHKTEVHALMYIARCHEYLIRVGIAPRLIDFGTFQDSNLFTRHQTRGPYLITGGDRVEVVGMAVDRANVIHFMEAFVSLRILHLSGHVLRECGLSNMAFYHVPSATDAVIGFRHWHTAFYNQRLSHHQQNVFARECREDARQLFEAFEPALTQRGWDNPPCYNDMCLSLQHEVDTRLVQMYEAFKDEYNVLEHLPCRPPQPAQVQN